MESITHTLGGFMSEQTANALSEHMSQPNPATQLYGRANSIGKG
jgi:hypothetical protein